MLKVIHKKNEIQIKSDGRLLDWKVTDSRKH